MRHAGSVFSSQSRYIQSTVFDLVLFFLDNPIEKDQDSSVLIEERVINF